MKIWSRFFDDRFILLNDAEKAHFFGLRYAIYDHIAGLWNLWPYRWSMGSMTISLVYAIYDHITGLCDLWPYRWSMRYMTISLVYAIYYHIAGLCDLWPYRWSMRSMAISLIYLIYDHIAGLCDIWPYRWQRLNRYLHKLNPPKKLKMQKHFQNYSSNTKEKYFSINMIKAKLQPSVKYFFHQLQNFVCSGAPLLLQKPLYSSISCKDT